MVIRSLRRDSVHGTQRWRLLAVAGGVTVWSCVLALRLLYLQVGAHEAFVARSLEQQTDVIKLAARRGDILTRDGRTLATSIDLGSVYAHPEKIRDPRAAAALLAPILEMPEADLFEQLSSGRRFVWLQRKARPEVTEAISRLVNSAVGRTVLWSGDRQAVWYQQEAKRYYPHRSLAAHVLGWVDIDNFGQAGVERYYDDVIRGEVGTLNTLKDANNSQIGVGRAVEDPTTGQDLVVTLDWALQFAAERALADAVSTRGAQGGSIVALDPSTGEILALASYPTFNPNTNDLAKLYQSANQAVQGAFEPGSAFKVITAAAALHEGVVSEDEPIDCEHDQYKVANHVYGDWSAGGFGVLAFRDVLANSSNIGTIKVCQRMAPATYFSWLKDFGFGSRTGIDLPGEATGRLSAPAQWSKLTQASMAFGQEISTTAVQLASAVGAIANGGLLLRPHLLLETTGAPGADRRPVTSDVRRRVLRQGVARRTALMMEHVVATGTGKPAQIPGYRVAGKTSTAQKIDAATGRYDKYVAGFVGFLPVSDPRVLILVVIDEPQRKYGHGGSTAAAPAFREVALAAIRILRIPPDAKTRQPSWVTGGPGGGTEVTAAGGGPPLP